MSFKCIFVQFKTQTLSNSRITKLLGSKFSGIWILNLPSFHSVRHDLIERLKYSDPFSHSRIPPSGFYGLFLTPSSLQASSILQAIQISLKVSLLLAARQFNGFFSKKFLFSIFERWINEWTHALLVSATESFSLRWIDERKIRKDKVEEGDATYTPNIWWKTNVIDEVKISSG